MTPPGTRRQPRQAERVRSRMAHHTEQQARLKRLLAEVLRDYRHCDEQGYVQGKRGEGAGGRGSDVSDPTGELASSDPRSEEKAAVRAAQLKDDTARSMRTADRHMDDAIRSVEKALKQLSRPFVKTGDWSSIKGPDYGSTASRAEIAEYERRREARLARGEE